jgi:dTDP-D-glucose 4,6-dehydratase
MRTILGVEPSTSLREGLAATYEWFRAQQAEEDVRPRAMSMVERR